MFLNDRPPLERIYAGAGLNLLVLGRKEVQSVVPAIPYVVVSITDPGRGEAKLADSPLRGEVLRLSFDDIAGSPGAREPRHAQQDCPMSTADADAIVTFIAKTSPEIRLALIHCEVGVSRSAGVAAALSRIYND